jgi:hypothetical protein
VFTVVRECLRCGEAARDRRFEYPDVQLADDRYKLSITTGQGSAAGNSPLAIIYPSSCFCEGDKGSNTLYSNNTVLVFTTMTIGQPAPPTVSTGLLPTYDVMRALAKKLSINRMYRVPLVILSSPLPSIPPQSNRPLRVDLQHSIAWDFIKQLYTVQPGSSPASLGDITTTYSIMAYVSILHRIPRVPHRYRYYSSVCPFC